MKKFLALLLALAMTLSLVACGGNTGADQNNDADAGDGEKVYKVGMICDSSINDGGWGAACYNAMVAACEKMGWEYEVTDSIAQDAYYDSIVAYCTLGYDMIYAPGNQYTDAVLQAAEEYPDVAFALLNGAEKTPDEAVNKNVSSLLPNAQQIGWIAGALAGLMTESGKVGYVGGGNNTTQQSDKNAFIEGVASVDPSVEVKTVITGTFDDSALGKETAIAMMEDGVDVILQTCDHTGLGVLEACSENGVYCLGYTTDQSTLVSDGLCLTSMLIDIPYMISSQIDLIKAGGYGGQSFPGLHDGVVSMADFSDKVPADVAEQVNAVVDQIKSGDLVITPNYSEN